jgi:hypothetical protein
MPEEIEGKPVTFEDQVAWLQREQGLDCASAEAILRSRGILETFGAEQARGTDLDQPGIVEAMLAAGAGRVVAPFCAEHERRQEREAREEEKKMKPNAVRSFRLRKNGRKVTVRRLPREVPGTMFMVSHDFKPNEGPRSFYSLGVWKQQRELMRQQESVLPSPFAAIHAMSLG